MAQDFLRPKPTDTSDLGKRRMEDGQFRNPPTYSELGGFTSADKAKLSGNKMTLESGGPSSKKGKPI
jgi:hypothetical protein